MPQNAEDVQSDELQYYNHMIPRLNVLLLQRRCQDNFHDHWQYEIGFKEVKEAQKKNFMLAFLNVNLPFKLSTGASYKRAACILSQYYDDGTEEII